MTKLKIAFFGGDSHAGTINDMFQDSLPNHPLVESVDFEWTGSRWGKHAVDVTPRQKMMEDIEKYDLIFQNPYAFAENITPGFEKLIDDKKLWNKMIIYDIADDSSYHFPKYHAQCLLYLKRAWQDVFLPKDLSNYVPIDFPLFQEYLDVVPMDFYATRDMHITCTLNQAKNNSRRSIVAAAVEFEDFKDVASNIRPIHKTLVYTSNWALTSAATSYRDEMVPLAPRINWWYVYMHLLRRTQVLFGCANHTAVGDHRTWECFASGAMVVTDKIPVPMPNVPEPGKHYIQFDFSDIPKTMDTVRYFLLHNEERKQIAKAGLEYAIKWHSSDARIAYVMEEILKRRR